MGKRGVGGGLYRWLKRSIVSSGEKAGGGLVKKGRGVSRRRHTYFLLDRVHFWEAGCVEIESFFAVSY